MKSVAVAAIGVQAYNTDISEDPRNFIVMVFRIKDHQYS